MSTNSTMYRALKLFCFSLLLGMGLTLLTSRTTSALTPNDIPDTAGNSTRAYLSGYDASCPGMAEKYAVISWLSPKGQPVNDAEVWVDSGATTIELQYNALIFLCQTLVNVDGRTYPSLPNDGTPTGAAVLRQNYRWFVNSGATDGYLNPNMIGSEFEIGYNSTTRYWFGGGAGTREFNYVSNAPITSDKTITVTLTQKSANRYSSGATYCVMPLGQVQATSYPNYRNECPNSDVTFTLRVRVRQPPPSPATVQGRVYDAVTGGVIPGATIESCWLGQTVTDGNGDFFFTAPDGGGYCLRVIGAPGNYDMNTVRTRPWNWGYNGCAPNAVCWQSTYECQEANRDNLGCDGSQDWDRPADVGFDFVITPRRPPQGFMNVNCDTLSGRANDPDYGGSIRVHIYMDGSFIGETTTDGGGWYSFSVAPWKDWGTRTFAAYGLSKDSTGAEDGYNFPALANSGSSPGVCAAPICGNVTYNPANPEPGTPFTATTNFIYSPGSQGRRIARADGHVMVFQVTGLYSNGDQPYNNPVPPGSGQATTSPMTAPAAGVYPVYMNLSGGPLLNGGAGCSTTLTVYDKPYFRVFGGDVLAGASAFGTCTPGVGTIRGWNREASAGNATFGSGPYGGAGTQIGAFATGAIDQFVSAATRSAAGPPLVPKGLTFANTGGVYGGGWDTGNVPCQDDYFKPSGAPLGPVTNLTAMSGAYDRSGPLEITGGIIPPNRKISIYVDGDIWITGTGIQNVLASYTDINQIPSVRIIARGNIYIAPTVTQIDAILIAQPNGAAGGTIVTCSNGFAMPTIAQLTGAAAAPNNCRTKLTVFGALLARDVRFMRSNGGIQFSNNTQPYTNASIAEAIIYSPAVWLAKPTDLLDDREPYEAYTTLPPIL
jgi:hypothetical protein